MSTIPSRDDLAQTNRIFEQEVIEKGDYSALQRVYTKNARALPPGAETVRGRESIQATSISGTRFRSAQPSEAQAKG